MFYCSETNLNSWKFWGCFGNFPENGKPIWLSSCLPTVMSRLNEAR